VDRRAAGRFFADGQFHTPDRKARMVAVQARLPDALTQDLPFRLNTGRVRDQWHTMTRTGMAPRLSQHIGEPYLEINPDDAVRLGLEPASLARVSNPQGQAILRVMVSDRVAAGHPFAPMHWTAQTAPAGRVDALVPSVTDAVSGQPASKSTAVAITPFAATWYGFAISRDDVRPDCDYWAKAPIAGGVQVEMAGLQAPADWALWAGQLFGLSAPSAVVSDPARRLHRMAFMVDGRLAAALFVARDPVELARTHLAAQIGQPGTGLLAGRPGMGVPDPGPTVCACLNVGLNTIVAAIASQGLRTVDQIGAALQAGTNCGSCRPELAALLATRLEAAE